MNDESRTVTIGDVAKLAGVSEATVSRALRGLPNVAPSTRARVQEIADRIDYRADPAASRLAAGRTRTVAVAVPALNSWYFAQVMAAAEAVLTDAGYDLLLFRADGDASRRHLTHGPLVKRADGLIVVDLSLSADETKALRSAGVAVVTIGMDTDEFSSVGVDDVGVADLAVGHLIGLGHQRIAILAGPKDDPMRFDVPRKRCDGYVKALTEAGLPVDPELERIGNFSVAGAVEAMCELLDLDEPPTAVFAMSDEMAFGALRAIWQRDLAVPGDISVVGVDDHEFSSVVGLTTVAQDVAKHGTAAAQILLQQLGEPDVAPVHREVPIELVVRTTTAPPSTGR